MDASGAQGLGAEGPKQVGRKLAPYNPTNLDAVLMALEMLQLNEHDIFYDLGCGDGRLLVEVSHHTRAVSIQGLAGSFLHLLFC